MDIAARYNASFWVAYSNMCNVAGRVKQINVINTDNEKEHAYPNRIVFISIKSMPATRLTTKRNRISSADKDAFAYKACRIIAAIRKPQLIITKTSFASSFNNVTTEI